MHMLNHQVHTQPQEYLDPSSRSFHFKHTLPLCRAASGSQLQTDHKANAGGFHHMTTLPSLNPLNPADQIKVHTSQSPDG